MRLAADRPIDHDGSLPRLPIPLTILLAAPFLLWPAMWNLYPIVFADTGTYLSQAIERYAGWDRPIFYSLFMLPLHATVTVWPVIVVQALITAYVLHLVSRILTPTLPATWFITGVAILSGLTWLPFMVSELMPDLFTPLLILLLAVLAGPQDRLGRCEQWLLLPLAAFMIASQHSSLPLSCVLIAALLLLAGWRDRSWLMPRRRPIVALLLPVALAVASACSVNLIAHKRFTISPFGNVFLLARVIYDGPGMAVLRRDCPAAGWRLCPFLDRFPADSDGFLWTPDSPLNLAGGPKRVSGDAGAIILAAVRAEPIETAYAVLANTLTQLQRFQSGDGLQAWPANVTPTINRDFPQREQARYAAARQQRGILSLSFGLATVHEWVALLGVVGCLGLLPGAIRRRARSLPFLMVVVLALPVSAAITGALSAPHDRYQSRIMWLPPFIGIMTIVAGRRPTFPTESLVHEQHSHRMPVSSPSLPIKRA